MLWKLATNASQLVERETLYKELIGREYDGLDRSADVRISRLRKKLNDNPQNPYRIKTIWGKGFFFRARCLGLSMARLFVSLYLLIALGIVGLSAVLEQIFFDNENQIPRSQEQVISLIEALNTTDDGPKNWLTRAAIQFNTLNPKDIAWLEEEQTSLTSGKAVSLFDNSQGHQVYILTRKNELLEVNLAPTTESPPSFLLYSSVFFILLAGLLAIWVWPLWRDLTRLKGAANNLQPDGSIETIKLPKRSLIKPIADALNNMSQQVRQLIASQSELTGAVAHEFRTPLSRLKFALAMQSSEDKESIQAMNHDIDELEKLVQEMLSYTSMEVQIPEMNMSEIPLGSLCQSIVNKLDEPTKKRLSIKVSGENISVLADSHYLERAIENLVLNACRYAASHIEIHHFADSQHVFVRVEDDGSGVEPALREKIFEPFFRPDDSRNRKRGGAGLGLAIVKRIMQWHKGDCWVEAGHSGGASFLLKLERSGS